MCEVFLITFSYLVKCVHFCWGAIWELDVAEVSLGTRYVLGGGNKVVAGLGSYSITTLEVTEKREIQSSII